MINLDQNSLKNINVNNNINKIHIDLNKEIVTKQNHLIKIFWDQKKKKTEIIRLLKIYFNEQH